MKKIKKLEIDYLVDTIKSQNETIIKQSQLIERLCEAVGSVTGKDIDEDFLTYIKSLGQKGGDV